MRNRRRVPNCQYSNARVCNCANRRLAAASGPFHPDFALLHSGFVRLFGSFVSCLLRREGSALARASKPTSASGRLRDEIALKVGNRNHRVIERGRNVRNAHRHVLLLFLTKNFFLSSCFCHFEFLNLELEIWSSAEDDQRSGKSKIDDATSSRALSSSQPSSVADPYECGRLCACVGHGQARRDDVSVRDSSQCPSIA